MCYIKKGILSGLALTVMAVSSSACGEDKKTHASDPNPIQVCDGSGLGITTISWHAPGVSTLEVRINTPTGSLMAKGEKGSVETGKWVRDGTIFMIIDSASGEILDQIKVEHTQEGCP